jgi:hypothetical protein
MRYEAHQGVSQHLDNLLPVAAILLNDLISDSPGSQVGARWIETEGFK